jgi:hypothetical protein
MNINWRWLKSSVFWGITQIVRWKAIDLSEEHMPPCSKVDWFWTDQSQSYFTTEAPCDSRHSNFIIQLNTCGYSPYVTSSLTRGWVCRLQLLLVSPSQLFSGPSPAGPTITFSCLWFETPPIRRARSPHLYPPGTGWPSYTPSHWVPFSSPSTTGRATVDTTWYIREDVTLHYYRCENL